MMLAEDLLLLLTDDETGKLVASGAAVDVALGGALLAELASTGHVDVAGSDERVREGRLVVRDPSTTGNTLLDEALATVAEREGEKPQNVVARLGKRSRVRLHERLVEAGVLRAAKGRVLGIFPSHRWPAEDTAHEASVRERLVTALRDGTTTDPRTGALVSLLLALGAVHKAVAPSAVGLSKREMKANAKRIAEGNWAATAVHAAIADSARSPPPPWCSADATPCSSRRPAPRNWPTGFPVPGWWPSRPATSSPVADPVPPHTWGNVSPASSFEGSQVEGGIAHAVPSRGSRTTTGVWVDRRAAYPSSP